MKNLFEEYYNKENNIELKKELDIYDECSFSCIDILKEKEVKVVSKVSIPCKCVQSVNFNTYYDKCDKCNGSGKLTFNGNEVVCNRCYGKKKIVKNICPLCNGEGNVIKKGNVDVKLHKGLKEGDIVTVVGKGKEENGIKGDLFIRVHIHDLECFEFVGNDVYDRRMISFSKEEIAKEVSKNVETIKGFVKVKSSGEEVEEVVRLENQGIDDGDYYICLNNELVSVKGKDVYKNVIIDKNLLGFYLSKAEMSSEVKCLTPVYFKDIHDDNYVYVEIEEANNFKIVKLKGKGLSGKHGGENGDLYLKIYFDDEFKALDDKLVSYPIKLNRYEVNDGKKVLDFNKNKITLSFNKGLNEEKKIEVKNYGFMVDKNTFDSAVFNVNPFDYDVYKVSVRVKKGDKVIYLKDYKKYFYEEVKQYKDGLKVVLNRKKDIVVVDNDGNKIIVKVIV